MTRALDSHPAGPEPADDEDGRSPRRLARRGSGRRHVSPLNSCMVTWPSAATPSRRSAVVIVIATIRRSRRRRVLDVPDVVFEPLRPRDRVATVDLCPPGDTRERFEASALALRVAVDVDHRQGSRTDQAHVALDHRPQLRQLVQAGRPEFRAEGRESILVGQQVPGRVAFSRHRTELGHLDRVGTSTSSRLTEQHRRPQAQPHRHRHQGRDRGQYDEGGHRKCEVDGTFRSARGDPSCGHVAQGRLLP